MVKVEIPVELTIVLSGSDIAKVGSVLSTMNVGEGP